mmetsp:Transcript_2921/g.9732  ORF Transcript_2921/g.9732 Transcript_2921/m.9732 type:complete len:182 (+) Transcript_2921:247-792(+)
MRSEDTVLPSVTPARYGSYRHSREGREWRARLRDAVEELASQQTAAGLQAGGQQKRHRPEDDAGGCGGGGGGGGAGSTVPLLQALETLADDSSLDAVAAERDKVDVVAIERGEAAPAEVAAATSLLAGQRKRLATELEQRRQLILALAAACEAQHACCAKLQASAGEAEALVARIEAWQGA